MMMPTNASVPTQC